MKFRDAAWFWFGMVAALSATDSISFHITPRTRFPEPAGAVLFFMVGALIPALGFYISGRISTGLFPKREMRTHHGLLLLIGAAYPLAVGGLGAAPQPYGKVASLTATFLTPCLTWILLSRKIGDSK